jgi:hypothetical protein
MKRWRRARRRERVGVEYFLLLVCAVLLSGRRRRVRVKKSRERWRNDEEVEIGSRVGKKRWVLQPPVVQAKRVCFPPEQRSLRE